MKAHKDYIDGMITMARVANITTLDTEEELKDNREHLANARIAGFRTKGSKAHLRLTKILKISTK